MQYHQNLQKKVIEESGLYTKDDWISVNNGPWKSCSEINDVEFKSNEALSNKTCDIITVRYNDDVFNSFYEVCGENKERIHHIMDYYDTLAVFECTQNIQDGGNSPGIICYRIQIGKDMLSIELIHQNENNLVRFITLDAKDHYGKELHIADSVISIFSQRGKWRSNVLSLETLNERTCSPSLTNGINIFANARFIDGTPCLIAFEIPSIIIDRLSKYIIGNDNYSDDYIIRNNDSVLFTPEDESLNYISSSMFLPPDDMDKEMQGGIDSEEEIRGCVYILVNESYPELVKIGMTGGSVSNRISQLNSTGVPTPYECYYAAYVDDMAHVEKVLHNHFSKYRVNARREFFKVSAKEVHKVLSGFGTGDATFS